LKAHIVPPAELQILLDKIQREKYHSLILNHLKESISHIRKERSDSDNEKEALLEE
jgi:hypothetical protein